jgi:peptidoglycan endopeptidase LytF
MKHIVKVGESLYAIASKYGLTVSELRQLNPLVSSNLRIGQELMVGKSTTQEVIVGNTSTNNTPKIAISDVNGTHTVVAGDTLFGIAQRYKITVAQIMDANKLTSAKLSVGQRLQIPKNNITPPIVVEIPEFHVVGKGDTWFSVAQRYKLNLNDLKTWNNALNDLLREGQKLILKAPKTTPPPIEKEKEEAPIKEIPQETSTAMRTFLEARKQFKLTAVSGEDIFGEGLRSAVGRNHINRPEDLSKIQQRLVQLGILPENHTETPEDIYKINGRGAITSNLIPKTIEAIEQFQTKFKVRFWIEHSSRVAMFKTSSFTQSVVMPDDITYRVLREYTQYKLTFTHPQDGLPITVKFYNFPQSSFTQYYQGVSYIGSSCPEIPLSVFQRLGVNTELAQALQYVSKNEGNFDALNTYDKAVFSYGFIQFAGNGGGFAQLLAHIKHKAPKLFQEFFQAYGIDVDYVVHQGAVRQSKVMLANPYDKGGKFWLEGLEAEMALREDKQLYGIFIRAGYHLPIITLQIDAAIRFYVVPALQILLNIRLLTGTASNIPITQLINSPLGLAILIDTVVNQWVTRTQDIFRQAFENIASQNKTPNILGLQQLDERKIVEQIIADAKTRNDMRLVQRATNILQSGLSSQKTTSPLFV